MEALTVACVETGDYLGMGRAYVERLAMMCREWLPPHEFVVLSDREHAYRTILLDSDLAGWWTKLELFKPGRLPGRTVYFDLDVTLDGPLDGLVDLLEEGDFWALDDFAWPLSRAAQTELMLATDPNRDALRALLGGWGTVNSSVMLWRDEAGADIWRKYTPEAAAGLHGDQNWITRTMGDRVNLIPSHWARSFKLSGRSDAPITVYHGQPKPHQVSWH